MKSPTCLLLALVSYVQLTTCADIVFPYVRIGAAGKDTDEFKDVRARVLDVQNSITTYSVGCITTKCATWTIAIGPSTFERKYSDLPFVSSRDACTFQGSPATAASCEGTHSGTIRTRTMVSEHHFTVPGGSGNFELYNVMSATLKVIDGTGDASITGAPTTATTTSGSVAPSAGASGGSGARSTGFARETGAPAAKWIVGMGAAVGAVIAA